MKTKTVLIALGATLAVVVALHIGHEIPKEGKCPLQSALEPAK